MDLHLINYSSGSMGENSTSYQVDVYCQFFLLPPATKLGQGNIFSSVCQEFCSRGEYLGRYPPGRYTPRYLPVTPPPDRETPPGQVYPPGRYTSRAGTAPWQVHPVKGTPPCQILRDTVNERAVLILLECILVKLDDRFF